MKYEVYEDEHYYVCHDGRELRRIRTEAKEQDGYTQTFEVYGCADCSECGHKAKCIYKYDAGKDAEKNKVMKINERWEALKEGFHANIQGRKLHRKKERCPNQHQRGLRPKTGGTTRKKASPAEASMLKSTEFCGRNLFCGNRSKKCHYPTAPL